MIDKSVHSEFSSIKLDQLVYVELEARNGGMMLTVSEEGFTFRAVTSVRPSGRIPFSFIVNGNEKLEGYGEIKWTKDEGKVAGLQFIDISTEFLNALRRWLAQLSAPGGLIGCSSRRLTLSISTTVCRLNRPKVRPRKLWQPAVSLG